MKNIIKIIFIIVIGLNAQSAQSQTSKAAQASKVAKSVAAEIARSEAWNKIKQTTKKAIDRERKCKNTQSGNNANSTAAIRTC